jgi:hypothetical protein
MTLDKEIIADALREIRREISNPETYPLKRKMLDPVLSECEVDLSALLYYNGVCTGGSEVVVSNKPFKFNTFVCEALERSGSP